MTTNEYHRPPFIVDLKPTVGGGYNVRPVDPSNPASFRTYNDADGKLAHRIANLLNRITEATK